MVRKGMNALIGNVIYSDATHDFFISISCRHNRHNRYVEWGGRLAIRAADRRWFRL